MRRLLACFILCAVVVPGAGLADRGDPQKALTPTDQKRAKAMLLQKADLGPAFERTSSSSDSSDPYCKELDESDLTLTGDADMLYRAGHVLVATGARVYRTRSEANSSWRRTTSAGALRCMRREFAREAAKDGGALLSLDRVSFPRLGDRTYAYRFVTRLRGTRVVVDLVTIQRSRAHAGALFASGVGPVPKPEQVRLARVIAGRMATTMRGA